MIRDRRTWGRVTDDDEIGCDTGRAMAFFGAMFVLALIALAVAACEPSETVEMYGDEPPVETIGGIYGPADPITTPPTTVPPPIATVSGPAEASKVAVRVSLPPTTTISPIAYVDGLPYLHFDLDPAMEAYRIVATERGWTPESIERWTPFVYDVMSKESGGCWNTLGGAVMVFPQTGCLIERQGGGQDAGFGQTTDAIHGQNGVACRLASLCGRAAVISSPWASMTAMLVTMEQLGRYPWCDYEDAPDLHNCSLVGYSERPTIGGA